VSSLETGGEERHRLVLISSGEKPKEIAQKVKHHRIRSFLLVGLKGSRRTGDFKAKRFSVVPENESCLIYFMQVTVSFEDSCYNYSRVI